jgi:hypothetical protein
MDRDELIETLLKRWSIGAGREQTRRALYEYLAEQQPDEVLRGGGVRLFVLAPERLKVASYYSVNIECVNLGPGEAAVTSIVVVHLEHRLEAYEYGETRRAVFSAMAAAFAKLAGLDDAQCNQIAKQEEGLPQRAN